MNRWTDKQLEAALWGCYCTKNVFVVGNNCKGSRSCSAVRCSVVVIVVVIQLWLQVELL